MACQGRIEIEELIVHRRTVPRAPNGGLRPRADKPVPDKHDRLPERQRASETSRSAKRGDAADAAPPVGERPRGVGSEAGRPKLN